MSSSQSPASIVMRRICEAAAFRASYQYCDRGVVCRVLGSIEFRIFPPSKSARRASKLPVHGFKLAVFPVCGKYGIRIFCPKSAVLYYESLWSFARKVIRRLLE